MERAQLERDLTAVAAHLAKARDELALVTDQLSALSDEAHTARLRAMMSEIPQASIPYERVQAHLETLQIARDAVGATIAQLENVHNELLEQMLALDAAGSSHN